MSGFDIALGLQYLEDDLEIYYDDLSRVVFDNDGQFIKSANLFFLGGGFIEANPPTAQPAARTRCFRCCPLAPPVARSPPQRGGTAPGSQLAAAAADRSAQLH